MRRYVNWFLLFSSFLFSSILWAQPVYYEGNGHQLDCNTVEDQKSASVFDAYLQYDSKTTVTMYGDSRSDFADLPPYNYSNMNALIGADISNWNVQNFGVAGWTSLDLLSNLSDCFRKDPMTGNPLNPKYITASKVAFEIGGNDMYHVSPFVYLAPWIMPITVKNTKANIEWIVGVFQRRNKKVLLIGNYPAGGVISQGKDFADPPKTSLLSLGFAVSVGLNALENEYLDLVHRYQIEYLRVWDDFALFPGAPLPRADLTFIDLIHPNPAGFQVWGTAVGDKFRSLGWNIPDSVPEPPPPAVVDPPPPSPPLGIDPLLLCFLLKICHL